MRAPRTGWTVTVSCLLLLGCTPQPTAPPRTAGAVQTGDESVHRPWPLAAPTSRPAVPAPPPSTPRLVARDAGSPALLRFGSCAGLLSRLRKEALRQVGPYGLGVGMTGGSSVGVAPAGVAAGSGTGAAPAPAHSGTNNQEAGIDEADQVKTDGRLLVTVRHAPRGLQLVDLSGSEPALRGFLPLPDHLWNVQLLVVGERMVALATAAPESGGGPRTSVKVLDLADPDAPRVEREFVVDGGLTAARALGGRVVLVVQSDPQTRWAHPADGSAAAAARATAENRRRVRAAPLDDWLPSVTSTSTGRRAHARCADTMAPAEDSGVSMTSLVSLDPESDRAGDPVSIAGSGSVVYAATGSVYVTTSSWSAQSWEQDGSEVETGVHRFDLSVDDRPRYAGSGSVPGTLVGQYAMSEHAGHLRVASTLGRTRAAPGEIPPSQSMVTVLRSERERLVQTGQVRGLGPGERIYGVRFLGALAYVVTFRETDPLHALDLSDPARPSLRGELHVTGYSSYLHPVGGDHLLGIGQEVEGNAQRGTQVSVFDVADLDAPALRSRHGFPAGWSSAEHDPHALLWWPASRLAVVPLWQHREGSDAFTGAVALRVEADGVLTEVGRLEHPHPAHGIVRSVVLGDALLTVSEAGVMTNALDTLEERAWLPYR